MKTKSFFRKSFVSVKTPRLGISTRLILLILALSPALCTLSQTPQGFNYQAIARDGSGIPLISQSLPARITIQADSLGTQIIWQEVHSLVTSNSFGLINFIVGRGTRQAPSTVSTFSDIDWSVTPKFLKTEIYYSGSYRTMGVSKLWSVPYAAVAGDLAGSVSKLAVEGETSGLEEALFEVKNKDGQTVFAVYNEGVRVYVSDGAKTIKGGFSVGGFGTDKAESTKYLFVGKDSVRIYLDINPLTKGKKSGFAVGGYDLSKGTVQDYLDVSADSVRIYIDSDPDTKKVKGGFAVGGYDMNKGITGDYFNVSGRPEAEVINGEPRVLWYPAKEAFRAGNVLIESKDSVGLNSWASGYRSKAIGNWSQALGYQTLSRGDYSTAIGKNAVADSINSFAFGENARAEGNESYAFGRGAIAEGFRSFALGSSGVDSAGQVTGVAYAKGDYSFAIGQGSQALGKGSFTLGLGDTARGDYSVAIGYQNKANEWYSTALGYKSASNGTASFAVGTGAIAAGSYSTSIGYGTSALGDFSIALGYNTTTDGLFSVATGDHSLANGYCETAMGAYTKATGGFSTALGAATTASGNSSFATGRVTVASGDYSTAMGYYTTASARASTAMGYYSTASGTGSGATALGYYSTSSSDGSTAIGTYANAGGVRSTAIGAWTTASGSYSLALGYSTTAEGFVSTVMGYGTKTLSDYETVIGRYNTIYTPSAPPGAGWNSSDRLFIIGNGTGDAARSNAITVLKNGRVGLQSVTAPTYALELPNNSNTGIGQARAYAWTTYSDNRLKENQTTIQYGINEIMELLPKKYLHHDSTDQSGWQSEDASVSIGFVAQDVYEIIPEAVTVPENELSGLWSLNYDKIIPVIVKAMQEQQSQIESQQREIEELKSMISELSSRIASTSRH